MALVGLSALGAVYVKYIQSVTSCELLLDDWLRPLDVLDDHGVTDELGRVRVYHSEAL